MDDRNYPIFNPAWRIILSKLSDVSILSVTVLIFQFFIRYL